MPASYSLCIVRMQIWFQVQQEGGRLMTVGKFRQHYSRPISLSDPEQVNVLVLLIKMLIVCVFFLFIIIISRQINA